MNNIMVNNNALLSIFIMTMVDIIVNNNISFCSNRICGVFLSTTKPQNIIGGGTIQTKKPNWLQFEHYTLWCLWVCKASDMSCIGYNFDCNWHNIDLVLCNSELESICVIFWSPLYGKLKHSDMILSCCDNLSHDKGLFINDVITWGGWGSWSKDDMWWHDDTFQGSYSTST